MSHTTSVTTQYTNSMVGPPSTATSSGFFYTSNSFSQPPHTPRGQRGPTSCQQAALLFKASRIYNEDKTHTVYNLFTPSTAHNALSERDSLVQAHLWRRLNVKCHQNQEWKKNKKRSFLDTLSNFSVHILWQHLLWESKPWLQHRLEHALPIELHKTIKILDPM